jgi:hypothetical protein
MLGILSPHAPSARQVQQIMSNAVNMPFNNRHKIRQSTAKAAGFSSAEQASMHLLRDHQINIGLWCERRPENGLWSIRAGDLLFVIETDEPTLAVYAADSTELSDLNMPLPEDFYGVGISPDEITYTRAEGRLRIESAFLGTSWLEFTRARDDKQDLLHIMINTPEREKRWTIPLAPRLGMYPREKALVAEHYTHTILSHCSGLSEYDILTPLAADGLLDEAQHDALLTRAHWFVNKTTSDVPRINTPTAAIPYLAHLYLSDIPIGSRQEHELLSALQIKEGALYEWRAAIAHQAVVFAWQHVPALSIKE